jgi:hypothetical protein
MINIRTELLYAPNYYWEWLTVCRRMAYLEAWHSEEREG